MKYRAICNEYGLKPTLAAAGLPVVFALAAHTTGLQPDAESAMVLGLSGGVGVAFAIVAEAGAAGVAHLRRMRPRRGSRMIQRTQAAACAVPVAIALLMQGVPAQKAQDEQGWKDFLQMAETYRANEAKLRP